MKFIKPFEITTEYDKSLYNEPNKTDFKPNKWEIPFSPPKMTIRFSPLFGLRFKNINFSGDFGILMKKISSGDFSIFDN